MLVTNNREVLTRIIVTVLSAGVRTCGVLALSPHVIVASNQQDLGVSASVKTNGNFAMQDLFNGV